MVPPHRPIQGCRTCPVPAVNDKDLPLSLRSFLSVTTPLLQSEAQRFLGTFLLCVRLESSPRKGSPTDTSTELKVFSSYLCGSRITWWPLLVLYQAESEGLLRPGTFGGIKARLLGPPRGRERIHVPSSESLLNAALQRGRDMGFNTGPSRPANVRR